MTTGLTSPERTAGYAQLDWFLSLLTLVERDWLLIAALFPAPKSATLMIFAKMIRDKTEDGEEMKQSYHDAIRRLTELSFAESGDNALQVHPVIAYQLLENRAASRHRQPEKVIDDTLHAVAIVFLNVARDYERPQKAMLLLQGIEALLKQSDLFAHKEGTFGHHSRRPLRLRSFRLSCHD